MLWWLKILIKIFLSRLPIKYLSWSKLSIFRHGTMDKPEYAFKVAEQHFNRVSGTLKNQLWFVGKYTKEFSDCGDIFLGSDPFYFIDIENSN